MKTKAKIVLSVLFVFLLLNLASCGILHNPNNVERYRYLYQRHQRKNTKTVIYINAPDTVYVDQIVSVGYSFTGYHDLVGIRINHDDGMNVFYEHGYNNTVILKVSAAGQIKITIDIDDVVAEKVITVINCENE
jgi:hypothetical protein